MMLVAPQRLAHIRFGLSISTAKDMPTSGDPESLVNDLTAQVAGSLLLEGGTLALGHRWSSEGIMEHLAFKARDSRAFTTASSAEAAEPAILNLIAWPDMPPREDPNAQRLIRDGVLAIRQIPPPGFALELIEAAPGKSNGTPLARLARIRALTTLRRELVAASDARLCLGGETGKPTRRLPGVVEEALFTIEAGKPLYLSSALGGVSRVMADALLQRRIEPECEETFFTPPAVADLFQANANTLPVPLDEGPSLRGSWDALATLRSASLTTLGQQAGLSLDEYLALLTTPDVQRAVSLALTGILRLQGSKSGR